MQVDSAPSQLVSGTVLSDERTTEETTFVFHPEDDETFGADGEFIGRATCVFGGRKGPVPSALPDGVDEVRKGNDHVGKAYWPEVLEKSGSNKMWYKRW